MEPNPEALADERAGAAQPTGRTPANFTLGATDLRKSWPSTTAIWAEPGRRMHAQQPLAATL